MAGRPRLRARLGRAAGRLLGLFLKACLALVLVWLAAVALYRVSDPALTPLMLIRMTEGLGRTQDPRALADIAPALPRMVVAAEDNLFCRHAGIDWDAVGDAVGEYRERGRLRGASTITMQTARNLFLWPGGGFVRKAVEAPLALAIDFAWPKRRVVEVYLNIVEWGPGIYGAEAAAQSHFGVAAADLTERQASLLAAVLPNPRRWSAGQPTDYIVKRAAGIHRRAGQLGPLLDCLAE